MFKTAENSFKKFSSIVPPLTKTQLLAPKVFLSHSHSSMTEQSINTTNHWWPVPDFNLTCAFLPSTLVAHKCDNMNVVLQKESPTCTLPRAVKYWVWHGSNCMGSNQLDTQLKETWGLRAARQEAWLNSGDVHWTNHACPLWQNSSFFPEKLADGCKSRGSERQQFYAPPSPHSFGGPLSGGNTASNRPFHLAPSHLFPSPLVHNRHKMLNTTCSADDSVPSLRFPQRSGLWRRQSNSSTQKGVQYKTVQKHYSACFGMKGINVTNQDSQLKYDERHFAKEGGIKRWKKDRKWEK